MKKHPITYCAALIILIALAVLSAKHFPSPSSTLDDSQTLPLLPLSWITQSQSEDTGGQTARDVSELLNANPWTESASLTTLPVFKNTLIYDQNQKLIDPDIDTISSLQQEIAARLNMNINDFTLKNNAPSKAEQEGIIADYEQQNKPIPQNLFDPDYYIASHPDLRFTIFDTMRAHISFTTPIPLPTELNLDFNSPYEDQITGAEYLKSEFSDLISMKNPCVNVHGGSYHFSPDPQQGYYISFYDQSGSLTDQIVNYNLATILFYCEQNQLVQVQIENNDLTQKLGDYPIISADEARSLLGTTDPIVHTELIYIGPKSKYFYPCYRFLTAEPDSHEGFTHFRYHFVVAIDSSYIDLQ